ncbi:hypothetical protein A0H81_10614 [Grifola frondosa]|uniref:Uncharacterized protein n=1 Tax=Grifola frondosa TaxID=5627 RepID=A0A1C7LZE9_GRIFR|nr:hypothetical protein A0H81_10614 [Grifola frondosa]
MEEDGQEINPASFSTCSSCSTGPTSPHDRPKSKKEDLEVVLQTESVNNQTKNGERRSAGHRKKRVHRLVQVLDKLTL